MRAPVTCTGCSGCLISSAVRCSPAGGWNQGSAWDRGRDADLAVHGSAGIIADTLIGPIFAGMSAGINGESRFYIGIGRIFR